MIFHKEHDDDGCISDYFYIGYVFLVFFGGVVFLTLALSCKVSFWLFICVLLSVFLTCLFIAYLESCRHISLVVPYRRRSWFEQSRKAEKWRRPIRACLMRSSSTTTLRPPTAPSAVWWMSWTNSTNGCLWTGMIKCTCIGYYSFCAHILPIPCIDHIVTLSSIYISCGSYIHVCAFVDWIFMFDHLVCAVRMYMNLCNQ